MKKLLLCALLLSACAADSSSADLKDTPLAGTVGGQTWTFQAGDTDAFLSKDDPDFFATLYPGTFTACGFSQPAGNHLIVSIPKTPGEYPMSLSRNMTFVVGNDNKIAIDGTIVVDEVTATSIKGGLVASFDSSNEVNGRFEIPICAE